MTATRNKPALPTFEEMPVNNATVRITRAGDGLSEALKIEPKALHLGDECYYVLRGTVVQVNHQEKDEVITRVHTVAADQITEVEPDVANKMLQAAAEDLERRKAEVDGQGRLDDELAAEQREADDKTLPANEIAEKAAQRAKNPR